jgi:TolB protein
MSNFKPALSAVIISISILPLLASSCAAPAGNYKASGLPSLLAFSSDRDKTVHVYTINPDGTDNRTTSDDFLNHDGIPSWSPDGTRIAFSSNQSDVYEIWDMNADGSDRKQLTNIPGTSTSPKYSPDGSKIVFVNKRRDADLDCHTDIFVINANGGNMQQLTFDPVNAPAVTASGDSDDTKDISWNAVPTWAPDSTKILFGSKDDSSGVMPVLYTVNSDGTDRKKFGFLFPIEGTDPDWSPVTNQIVFVKGTSDKGEIWVMDAGSPFPGLTAKKLTDNTDNNHSPAWSPDGKQIAFISDTYGNDNIFIMNADGSNVRRVTYDKANDNHPAWR